MSDSHKGKLSPFKDKHHNKKSKELMSKKAKERLSNPENHPMYGKKCPWVSERNKTNPLCGENSSQWKGGITPLNKIIRECSKYEEWRVSVFQKDNFKCAECGKENTYLNAHHIKPFHQILKEKNIKSLQEALNSNELWDLDNGMTLCEECHNKIPKNRRL